MAWDHVRRAGGGCGADGETLAMVAADLDNQLYKIWNRLSRLPKFSLHQLLNHMILLC